MSPEAISPLRRRMIETLSKRLDAEVAVGDLTWRVFPTLHASGSNLSPFNRVSVYLSLNAVDNHIRRHKRPEYIAHRDFAPIATLPDDCLLKDYPVDLPWQNGMPASALETSLEELKLAA